MAKIKKEISKKHKVRNGFIVGAVVTALIAAGSVVGVSLLSTPTLIIMNSVLLVAALGLTVGLSVAANVVNNNIQIGRNKRIAKKSLEKIKQLDADASAMYSNEHRAKVVKKWAKANIVLAKRMGASYYGEYASTSGFKANNAAALISEVDAYNLLYSASTKPGKLKKYSKKVKLSEAKLSKIAEQEGEKSAKVRWTKSYDNVISGVTVLDRRTQVSCLTTEARDAYKTLLSTNSEVADNKCITTFVSFPQESGISQNIARAEDQSKQDCIKQIMLSDAYYYARTLDTEQRANMFPVVVESRTINKKTTKVLDSQTTVVSSYSDLEALVLGKTK